MKNFFNSAPILVTYVIVLLFGTGSVTKAQARAEMKADTVYYQGAKIYRGGKVDLWYGSKQNKDFAFVFMGSGLQGLTPLAAGWSKQSVLIDKVYKSFGKLFCRGVLVDAPEVRAMGGNKIFIDIEGAMDNKEISQR